MTSLIYNVIMLVIQTASGSQGPPAPSRGGGTRGPLLPIDENIWVMITIGVIFGIYVIYRRIQSINKAA